MSLDKALKEVNESLKGSLNGKVYAHIAMYRISPDEVILRKDYYTVIDDTVYIIEGKDGLKLTPSGDDLFNIYKECKFVDEYEEGTPYLPVWREVEYEELDKFITNVN